jgi:hypothetical protein
MSNRIRVNHLERGPVLVRMAPGCAIRLARQNLTVAGFEQSGPANAQTA